VLFSSRRSLELWTDLAERALAGISRTPAGSAARFDATERRARRQVWLPRRTVPLHETTACCFSALRQDASDGVGRAHERFVEGYIIGSGQQLGHPRLASSSCLCAPNDPHLTIRCGFLGLDAASLAREDQEPALVPPMLEARAHVLGVARVPSVTEGRVAVLWLADRGRALRPASGTPQASWCSGGSRHRFFSSLSPLAVINALAGRYTSTTVPSSLVASSAMSQAVRWFHVPGPPFSALSSDRPSLAPI
jgi:hypothetical protein